MNQVLWDVLGCKFGHLATRVFRGGSQTSQACPVYRRFGHSNIFVFRFFSLLFYRIMANKDVFVDLYEAYMYTVFIVEVLTCDYN